MINFSTVTEGAVGDPLVAILGLFAVGTMIAHVLLRKYPIGRAVVRVVFLLLLTIALLHADIVPYRPLQLTGMPFTDTVHAILKIAWWLWAAWFLVAVLRAVVVFQGSPREAKLLQDLLAVQALAQEVDVGFPFFARGSGAASGELREDSRDLFAVGELNGL